MASFISGISLTCFAASYGVAWLLEVAHIYWRTASRQLLMFSFVLAGLLAHTLYLGYRVSENAASPLASGFDWCLVAAWLLVVAYLYLAYYHPRAALGLTMLPLALALVAGAALADRTPFAPEGAMRLWGAVHGVALLVGTLAVMVGFVAGLMYLAQARRLKRKLPPTSVLRLPSLEWLEKVNSRAIVVSALTVGVGFLAGIILNLSDRGRAEGLPWTDPVIWSSGLMLSWLVAAAIFNGVYRPARRGRKVAYLTVVSFAFLALALAVLLLVDTQHSGQKQMAPASSATADLPSATAQGSSGTRSLWQWWDKGPIFDSQGQSAAPPLDMFNAVDCPSPEGAFYRRAIARRAPLGLEEQQFVSRFRSPGRWPGLSNDGPLALNSPITARQASSAFFSKHVASANPINLTTPLLVAVAPSSGMSKASSTNKELAWPPSDPNKSTAEGSSGTRLRPIGDGGTAGQASSGTPSSNHSDCCPSSLGGRS